MGTRFSQGCAALVLSAAFAASRASAQIGSDPSPHLRVQPGEGQNRDGSPAASPTRFADEPNNGRAVVSADLLRHRVTGKARQMLLKAFAKMDSGDHEAAIEQLRKTLAKHPDSAAYVHNLLGVEYVKIDRVQAAISSFEQAVSLLPHDAMTHYNFGLSLVCAGDFDRAEQEVQRALNLEPANPRMQQMLAQLQQKHSGN